MAKIYKYIGFQTKPDGKVDVQVHEADGTLHEWTGVVPNVDTLDLTAADDFANEAMRNSKDITGQYNYEEV